MTIDPPGSRGRRSAASRPAEPHGCLEWWSILILRDALHGYTRFEEFRESLGVAPNILTTRLARLVEDGFLERRQYSGHPPRHEYLPTEAARDFRPVLLSLMAFGNKHFAPEGAMVEVVNTTTGKPADIGVYDRATGLPIVAPEYRMVPGPAANARVKKRYAARKVEAGAA